MRQQELSSCACCMPDTQLCACLHAGLVRSQAFHSTHYYAATNARCIIFSYTQVELYSYAYMGHI